MEYLVDISGKLANNTRNSFTSRKGTFMRTDTWCVRALPIFLLQVCFVVRALAAETNPGFACPPSAGLSLVEPENIPPHGTFWSLQRRGAAPWPCYSPFLREAKAPVYVVDAKRGVFLVDDSAIDYVALNRAREAEQALQKVAQSLGLLSTMDGLTLETDNDFTPLIHRDYLSTDLWIELTGITNDDAYLTLHGTESGKWCQLQSKTNLAQLGDWTLGEVLPCSATETIFTPVYVAGISNQFFRGQQAAGYVAVTAFSAAGYEANPVITSNQNTGFRVSSTFNTNVTVYYRLGGMASNGVDYALLNGLVTVPASSGYADVVVAPIADNLAEGDETVILTIIPTNHYLTHPSLQTASVLIKDQSTLLSAIPFWPTEAIEANGPPGEAAQSAIIQIYRFDDRGLYPPLLVHYAVSGTASNGVDYVTFSGTVVMKNGDGSTNLTITPISDSLVEGTETMTLTLLPTNTYAVDATAASITTLIADSSTTVFVARQQDAIEPNPYSSTPKQTGIFSIFRQDSRPVLPALTITYQLSGMASNNIDYTNLTGTVAIPEGVAFAQVFVEPRFDGQLEADESVTLTLTHVSDGYLIDPISDAATIWITNNLATNTFQPVAQIYKPAGIDYHVPSNSLIVSTNYNSGQPYNFARIWTTGAGSNAVSLLTNWSGVHGVLDEVKLVTIKTTGNGFTNGDIYFGSGNAIGWLSADGTRSNLNWCVLTNAVQSEAIPLRGSLCQDTTGIFSNHIIAVTSYGDPDFNRHKGVWRISPSGVPTLLANLDTPHLEGVIVLPNDSAKWGPWAGKIVTGDESWNLIHTIDTNGAVTTFDATQIIAGGIRVEDFDIVPAGQDLYACDLFGNVLVQLSQQYLTNFVGDLLITHAGEFDPPGKVFLLHWDAAITNFATVRVPYRRPDGQDGLFEHATFAPIHLPPLTP